MEIFFLASLVVISLAFFKGLGAKALPIVILLIFVWGLVAFVGGVSGLDIIQR